MTTILNVEPKDVFIPTEITPLSEAIVAFLEKRDDIGRADILPRTRA
jgi:hypothetical protein